MAQTRYINFGDSLLATRVNNIATSIVEPSVLKGAELTVGMDGKSVNIAPHEVMLASLLMIEDAVTNIQIETTLPSGTPTDYTIVYEHTNQEVQGGVPAFLSLKSGLVGLGTIPDAVVLGWVRWTGIGSALSPSMLIEAPKLKLLNPSSYPVDMKIPPFVSSPTIASIYVKAESTPGNITQGDVFDPSTLELSLKLENTVPSVETIEHLFPFSAADLPPRRIIIEAKVELGAKITVALLSEDGTLYPATGGEVFDTLGAFALNEFLVPNVDASKFLKNRKYFVSVTTQLNPNTGAGVLGTIVFISGVGTSTQVPPV